MTVAQQTPVTRHTANGVSTVFAYDFLVLDEDELQVYLDEVAVTSGFTLSGVGEANGGDVTFSVAPDAGVSVTIIREMIPVRETDYQNSGDFKAATVNRDFDRGWLFMQQLAEQIGRAPLLSVASLVSALTFPDPAAAQYIRWNSAGTNLENAASVVSSGTFLQSGAGAVEREANAKMADVINGRDFGVLGNGADETVQIQRTLAATPEHAIAWFQGESIISDEILLETNNVTVTGQATWIAKDSTNFEYMLYGENLTGVKVTGITFDANKANRSSGQNVRFMGAAFIGCTQCGFEKCTAKNTRGYGGTPAVGLTAAGQSTRCFIENCDLIDCGDSGTVAADGVFTSGTQNSIDNCRAYNCTDTAFVIENSNFSGISGSFSYDCAAAAAITVAGNDDKYGNYISGLTARNWDAPSTGGIQIGTLSGTGNLYDSSLTGITMYANTGAGYGSGGAIWVRKVGTGKAIGVDIVGLTVNGASYGVRVDNGDNVCVTGAIIKGVSSTSVYFVNGVDHSVKASHLQGGDYGVLTSNAAEVDVFCNTFKAQSSASIAALDTSTINNHMNVYKNITGSRTAKDAGATINSVGMINAQPVLSNILTDGVAGTLAKKVEVYDRDGASQGFLYLYSS